ncbi:MAG: hypothetical protein WAL79_10270 [Nitrososphaeraceae archaeon]
MNLGIKAVICISFLGVLGLGLSFWATGMHTTYGQISTTPNNQTVDERLYAQKLYESPMTLVLRGEGLGKAIDNAKLNGFTIDGVTVFTETSQPYGNTTYLTDVYSVFMSKK